MATETKAIDGNVYPIRHADIPLKPTELPKVEPNQELQGDLSSQASPLTYAENPQSIPAPKADVDAGRFKGETNADSLSLEIAKSLQEYGLAEPAAREMARKLMQESPALASALTELAQTKPKMVRDALFLHLVEGFFFGAPGEPNTQKAKAAIENAVDEGIRFVNLVRDEMGYNTDSQKVAMNLFLRRFAVMPKISDLGSSQDPIPYALFNAHQLVIEDELIKRGLETGQAHEVSHTLAGHKQLNQKYRSPKTQLTQ